MIRGAAQAARALFSGVAAHRAPPIYARPGAPGYRRDIDGLRAIAVVPVVLFHTGVPAISGGFVGVDIFFVISGYLITQVLLRDVAGNHYSIVAFYERRARRILPALFAVMIVCIALAPIVQIPSDYFSFSRSVLATVAFVSNVFFWRESGYFSAGAQTMPLLHTWSLAVEEQFYLLFPLLFSLFVTRARWLLVPLTLAAAILSFALSSWGVTHAATATFYLLPTRAWELLVGVLLALGVPPNVPSRLARELLALAGLILIVIAVVGLTEDSLFPGPNALFPCIGAALLIYANSQTLTITGQVLSLPPLVFCGLISYSLYLWHWPILVFAHQFSTSSGAAFIAALLLASFAAATLSWRYIERPFRRKNTWFTRSRLFACAGVSAAIVAALGAAGYAVHGWPSRFTPDIARLTGYVDYAGGTQWQRSVHQGTCFIELGAPGGYSPQSCFRIRPGKANLLVWGDSLAAHYFPGLEAGMAGRKVHVMEAAKGACPPVDGLEYLEARGCPAFVAQIWSLLVQNRPDAVLLSGNWVRGIDHSTAEMVARLDGTVERLQAMKIPVIIVGPSIQFDDRLPLLIARYRISGRAPSRSPLNFLDRDIWPLDAAMRQKFSGRPGVTYVSILDAVCPQRQCPTLTPSGQPLTFDTHHLLPEASKMVAGKALLQPVLQALGR